ncbi:Alcohol dehydrogenase zinc-binding domain protein [Paenibacillus curdlanolyticus YK9]|uniref:Alcohol dehydrogenase zinc-binding domain protein n=1 Tax=Paenibacillus curdlanolyticus YK9 TaxID=717606 RepID=E0IFX3_9BACL|nr:zinc-dependent alcohol dehydrogenase family protein [Paenibacillus curdlanolyticus]EFM08553.1 Alcohol dehydrogenase zinc-binding domain protein [Paenibacillus curdlanolyticus YK9]
MKAAVLEAFNQPLVVKEVADPTLTPDGIILKLEATGVCRSDWHGWAGHMTNAMQPLPHILGHEMSGIIEEVGSNIRNFKKGDRVIVPFSQGDGTCPHCQSGHHNVCDNMKMVGFNFEGGFAQYVHIPNADLNLLHLPDGVDFLTASAMGCRFMTAFHGVVSRGSVRPGEWVAVYGSGGVGLSAIQIASAAGANVIAVDIADDKLEFAKQFGAVATVNSKNVNAPQAIKELTKGGANISIDALGIQDTVISSLLSLNKRGRHVQIGISPNPNGGMTPVPVNLIMMNELSLLGSVSMPIPEYREMLQMVEKGKLNPGRLVTKQIALDDINSAFEDMTNYAGFGLTVVTKF